MKSTITGEILVPEFGVDKKSGVPCILKRIAEQVQECPVCGEMRVGYDDDSSQNWSMVSLKKEPWIGLAPG